MYAMWVLILISNMHAGYPTNLDGTTTVYVPGFFSATACQKAADAWVLAMTQDKRSEGGKAFCVYTGDHPT